MINFSKRDTIENLVAAITALPDETPNVPKDFAIAAKTLVIARLNSIPITPQVNAANVAFRVNIIGGFQQCEIQISTYFIKSIPPVQLATVASLIVAFLMLFEISGHAQTFGGGVTLNGQTNGVVNPATTNTVSFVPPSKQVTISNVAFTNEFFNIWYCGQVPGFTNLFPLFLFQTNSVGGTNNGTLTFTVTPPQLTFNVVTAMLVSNGPAVTGPTNTLFVP